MHTEPAILAALAAAPGLAISIFIYWKDKFDREPKRLLIRSFFLGALSTIPAIILSLAGQVLGLDPGSDQLMWSLISCIVGIGLTEEGAKYFFVRYFAYRNKAFNEPFDGITYSVMVAMGFATLENFLYVFEYGIQTAVIRMFLSVPAHAVFGVIIGYYLGHQKCGTLKGAGPAGLILASVLHGLFDFFLFNDQITGSFLGAIASFYLGVRFSLRAIRQHQQRSPFIG